MPPSRLRHSELPQFCVAELNKYSVFQGPHRVQIPVELPVAWIGRDKNLESKRPLWPGAQISPIIRGVSVLAWVNLGEILFLFPLSLSFSLSSWFSILDNCDQIRINASSFSGGYIGLCIAVHKAICEWTRPKKNMESCCAFRCAIQNLPFHLYFPGIECDY